MDSTGIRANMSAQQLIDHEVHERSLRNSNRQDGKVSTDSSGSSSLSSSNLKINTNESPCVSVSSANSSSGETRIEPQLTKRQIITVSILCFVNLINYMDRYTIAGILTQIQCDLNIGDTEGGLLQTAFVAIYMICAPVFGYLGDRYSRRYFEFFLYFRIVSQHFILPRLIMAAGIFVWSLTTLLGSYMTNFWAFLAMRSLVGVGEASYSTIAPTIISDLFVGDTRSKFLALFYFAIPVGSGLGYIVGSEAARVMGSWHWGLRVTPIFGAIAVLLILLVVQDPPRGESEGAHLSATSWLDDIKSLGKNKSFVMSTAACTAVAFVAGALAWWGPKFIALGLATQQGHQDVSLDDVSYIFGLIAMIAGLLGVPLGSFLGQKLRVRYQRADPIVCGMGMLFSTPLMLAALFIAGWNTTTCFVVVFFGQVLLNLNWAIVADILLYTVIPTRRSTAEAFQILFSHALGDAGSPYLIGQISEILKKSFATPATTFVNELLLNTTALAAMSTSTSLPDMDISANCSSSGTSSIDLTTVEGDFKALQWAMSITIVVEVLGALFFFATAWYIVEDKAKVDRAVADGPRGFRAVSMKELPASLMWNGLPTDLMTAKKIGLDQAAQDVEQQTAVPVPGMSGTSNETTVLNAGPSSHRNAELEDRAYVNPAMEE
ncbi:protein spinster isoform X1 [Daphnia magna]|uniref:protein spinster isoform X1 n=1 Tax=Daphnia magna TaxID=35525 RepID=UPI001E1BA41E|nr:protein spinster isoform X1 [Daphnia magna]XP_045032538.1 protein spinster isoform X1 [Daphnia magna]